MAVLVGDQADVGGAAGLAAYRGPWAMESLAREVLLDEAARAIGVDPVEIRRRNLLHRADLPTTSALGIPIEDISPAECLEKLLTVLDVATFRSEQEEARKQGRYLGLGIATYIEPTGAAGSMPAMTGEMVNLRIEPTGKVSAQMGTFSQGHGTATTMAQVIAEHLGAKTAGGPPVPAIPAARPATTDEVNLEALSDDDIDRLLGDDAAEGEKTAS